MCVHSLALWGTIGDLFPTLPILLSLQPTWPRKGPSGALVWNTGNCFQQLKDTPTQGPLLLVVDLSKPYILPADPSDWGLGTSLSQVFEQGDQHPVAFTSHKLLTKEKNYATMEKECLAIVLALQSFQVYPYSHLFSLDRSPIVVLAAPNRNSESSIDAVGYSHPAIQLYSGAS